MNKNKIITQTIQNKLADDRPECLVLRYEYLGEKIASGYTDGSIYINYPNLNESKLLNYSGSSITTLRWKPHRQNTPKNLLLTGDISGNLIYWHTSSGKIVHRIEENNISILCMDYSPCGEYFATGNNDKTVRIYDDNMKIKIFQYNPGNSVKKGHKERINSICYGTEPNILVSGGWDYEMFIYDTRTNIITGSIKGPYICGDSIDIKDNLILSGSCNEDYIQLWDIRNLKCEYDKFDNSEKSNIYTAQFGKNNFGIGTSSMNSLRTYNLEDYSNKINLEYLPKAVYTLHFTYDGEYCAFSGADSIINIVKV